MFWAGLLCGLLLTWVVGLVVFFAALHSAQSEPLSREETERLAAKVRSALERQSLTVVKPLPDVDSQLIGRN